ncbi:uncharacterized protein LOC141631935 [Silene latifolia]|uniref:uncharacterized protein LOC141631935 n=1 Tax=Silene latifolia TaxID=37657 RepID=UPI003D789045
MRKPELLGHMSKWSMHLSRYDIQYEPRTAIKSQALADFVSDFNPAIQNLAEKEILILEESRKGEAWTLHTDGALNQRGTGVGLVLRSPQGDLIVQAVCYEFKATNNEAEYEALILGLQLALNLKVKCLQVYNDSLFIFNHVKDSYTATDSKMIAYLKVAKSLKQKFKAFKIVQVPRDQNAEADALATLGATFKPNELSNIPIMHVLYSTIQKLIESDRGELGEQQDVEQVNGAGILANIEEQQAGPDWCKPYLEWLMEDKLLVDQREVRGFKMKATRFMLVDNVLFRKSLAGPYLGRLDKIEAQTVLHAIHSGECENHAGDRSLSNKSLRQGYFWPTMCADVVEYVKKCDASPKNPHSNGQAESSNKIIVEKLRKRLEELGAKWADELPLVLWSDRITQKTASGQTAFSLVFGAEEVIPLEVIVPTHGYGCMTGKLNQVEMIRRLDMIDELRTSAQIRLASYKQPVARNNNKNVKIRFLEVGDLVFRKVFQNTKNHKAGKFADKWEGPYQVEGVVGRGAYKLMTMPG